MKHGKRDPSFFFSQYLNALALVLGRKSAFHSPLINCIHWQWWRGKSFECLQFLLGGGMQALRCLFWAVRITNVVGLKIPPRTACENSQEDRNLTRTLCYVHLEFKASPSHLSGIFPNNHWTLIKKSHFQLALNCRVLSTLLAVSCNDLDTVSEMGNNVECQAFVLI
jgi:hypothetical protein